VGLGTIIRMRALRATFIPASFDESEFPENPFLMDINLLLIS
jgi:hypothetical protein